MKNYLFVFLTPLLFYSCESLFENTIELDEFHEEQLAVTAILKSTDSLTSIFLTKTISATDLPLYETVSNAQVMVEIDNEKKWLSYNEDTETYESDMKFYLEPNQSVKLEVNQPIFGLLTAEQTILTTPEEIIVEPLTELNQNKDSLAMEGSFNLSFNDPQNTDNYYIIEVFSIGEGFDFELLEEREIESNLFLRSENVTIEYSGSERIFFTDNLRDGEEIEINFDYFRQLGLRRLKQLEVRLIATTREGYLYQLTTDKFNDAQFNAFAEPVVSFSNIKNGVGIFSIAQVVAQVFQ